MRSEPSNSGKVMAREPRVAPGRHAANAACLTCLENAQCGENIATSVEIKIISVHFAGAGERTPGTAMNTTQPIGVAQP